jgi:hypothetical protein
MICLHSSGRSWDRDSRESLTYPQKKNDMALGQVILVANKAVPGLQSCVQVSVRAYAAPLAAVNETHCLQHLHINLESFLFYMWVHAYGTARSLSVRRNTKEAYSRLLHEMMVLVLLVQK